MFIEFGLANGAGGMAAAYDAGRIRRNLRVFEQQTNCTIPTNTARHDHRHWLQAEVPDRHWPLFQLYWTEDMSYMMPQRVKEN